MIALILGAALAAEPDATAQAVVSLGYETLINDPFLYRRGLRLSASVDLCQWVSTSLSAGAYPVLGRADYNAAARHLIDHTHLYPDISRVVATARTGAVLWPVRTHHRHSWTRTGVGAGVALFHTLDDLEALGMPTDTDTAAQTHPGLFVEIRAEAWRDSLGLRVRLETSWYQETVLHIQEDKHPTWLGVELCLRPGRSAP